jgi:hypothetical protein
MLVAKGQFSRMGGAGLGVSGGLMVEWPTAHFKRMRRRALGILSVVIALGWLTARLLVHVPHGSQPFIIPRWQLLSAFGLVPLVEVTASLFLHKRLLAKEQG